MHPLILGYAGNKILDDHFEKYFLDLQEFLSDKMDIIALTPDFLLTPDISTTIEYMRRDSNNVEKGLDFILEEWVKFSQGKKGEMFSLRGDIIPGTDIRLTTLDANPDNHIDIHPDHSKEDVGIGWGDIGKDEWLQLYAKAFSILHNASPGFLDELNRMVRKIIPMGTSVSKHNSASYSSCIGHLYMSYPIGMEHPELAIVEAIIHESNHNKLNLIMKNDPLILNTSEELYYSPYRPDARHIHGIYLGLHAMVAVFHVFFCAYRDGIIVLDGRWIEKSLTYVMKNAISIRVLSKYGTFTELGEGIFNEMVTVHTDTLSLIHSMGIAIGVKQRSGTVVREHFSSVVRSCPYIRY